MISPEIIRRYPFFAGLDFNQIEVLAKAGDEIKAEPGHLFFHEGDPLGYFYLILEGAVAILIELPSREDNESVAKQLTGDLVSEEAIVSTVGTGDIFGWSGLIPPNIASAGARALTQCKVIAFDCTELRKSISEDPGLGCILTQKLAQVIRDRLRDLRIETLALHAI